MTIWWAVAIIIALIHLGVSRWRDLGGTVIATYGLALMMNLEPSLVMWVCLLGGLVLLALGWSVAAGRGVWRPRLNGVAFLMTGACFPILAITPTVFPNVAIDSLRLVLSMICAFTASWTLIFALERPRPLRYTGRRNVPITSDQQRPGG